MAGLYKKEVLIRPTSTVSIADALTFVENWLNGFYLEADGDNFFADIFDPRGEHSRSIRVFHSGCKETYSLTDEQLIYTLTGDVTDMGFDDGESGQASSSDFVLEQNADYIALKDKVDNLPVSLPLEQNADYIALKDKVDNFPAVLPLDQNIIYTALLNKVDTLESEQAGSLTETQIVELIQQNPPSDIELIERLDALEESSGTTVDETGGISDRPDDALVVLLERVASMEQQIEELTVSSLEAADATGAEVITDP